MMVITEVQQQEMSRFCKHCRGVYTLVSGTHRGRRLTLSLGMFVAESKFRSAPQDFIPHILSSPPNNEALACLITKPAVEAKLLVRLENKAKLYGGEMDGDGKVVQTGGKGKIDVGKIVDMYRDHVIPLTRDVEVDYLIHRLDGIPQEQVGKWMSA